MTQLSPDESAPPHGSMSANGGRDVTQVGGNMTTSSTTNYNFVLFVIGLLALGGLAWGLNVGHIQGGNSSQQSTPASPVSSPSPQ